jgi:hypothetical protein
VEERIFKVTVDYGLSFEAMVRAGRYDWVDENITFERFPISGEGRRECKFVVVPQNDGMATTNELIAEIARLGLKPAKIEDILAFVAKFPNLRKDFPVLALGSHWDRPDGIRGFVYICWYGNARHLGLYYGEDGWDGYHRFLAFRE